MNRKGVCRDYFNGDSGRSQTSFLSGGEVEGQFPSPDPQSPITNIFYRWSGKGKSRRDQCPQPVWIAINDFLCAADKLDTIQPENYIFTPLTDRAARLPPRLLRQV